MAAKTPCIAYYYRQLSHQRSRCFLQLQRFQARKFSQSSTQRTHGPLPTFSETSNEDLDSLLSVFRSKVFLPAHLTRRQRELVYKKNLQPRLTGEEPVIVTVDSSDEKFILQPLDHQQDEPKVSTSFHKLLTLLDEDSDWKVVPPFLEGLKQSRRKLNSHQKAKLIRKAGEAGQNAIIMDCLRRVESTGLRLDDVDVAHEAILMAFGVAERRLWTLEGLQIASKFAKTILDLMQDERHRRQSVSMKHSLDPLCRAEIVGVPMSLAITRSVLFPEEVTNIPSKSEISREIIQTLNLIPNSPLINKPRLQKEFSDWRVANTFLIQWTPVWLGLRMATKALNGEGEVLNRVKVTLENQLNPIIERCAAIILERQNEESGIKRRGLRMYEEISTILE